MAKSKKRCQVVIEGPGGATVRKAANLDDAVAEAIRDHLDDPLVFLAVVVATLSVDSKVTVDAEGAPEHAEQQAFLDAAAVYADAVTQRWEREAKAEQEEQHAGDGCDCGECGMDDRERLLEEELRAARDGGDMGAKS